MKDCASLLLVGSPKLKKATAQTGLHPSSATGPRATLSPEVDAETFYRERMPTVVDDAALEEARLQSVKRSSLPPKRGSSPDLPPIPHESDAPQIRRRLAPLGRVPTLAKPIGQLGSLVDEPRTAYVLSFVDGVLPLETIVDVAGLPEIDVLRVLEKMIAVGAIVFHSAP